MEGGAVGHNIEKGQPNDHPSQICFNLVQRFQRRRFKCDQNMPNRYKSAERKISQKNLEYVAAVKI